MCLPSGVYLHGELRTPEGDICCVLDIAYVSYGCVPGDGGSRAEGATDAFRSWLTV